MQEKDKIYLLLKMVEEVKKELHPTGNMSEGTRLVFNLIVNYIEFMLTPCEDED